LNPTTAHRTMRPVVVTSEKPTLRDAVA
jgi:hypothetical protein